MKNSLPPRYPHPILVILFWLYVSLPLAWGVWSTLKKSMALFD
ncbi:MAG: MFS transporter small subunit [Gammaproteobacteria bacterium]